MDCTEFLTGLFGATEFWAAIMGSLVSGGIALAVQILVFRDARNKRNQEANEKKRTLGHSLLLKMVELHSNVTQLSVHIEDIFEEAEKNGTNPWQELQPLANLSDKVSFDISEKTLVLEFKDDDSSMRSSPLIEPITASLISM